MRQLSANPSKSFKHDTRAAMRGRLHGVGLRRFPYLLLVVHGTAVRCRGRDGSPICGEARRSLVDPAARKSTPRHGKKIPDRLAAVGADHAAGRVARLVASEKK